LKKVLIGFQALTFIILIVARCGYDGYPVPTGFYLDAGYLNAIVSFAFFIIVIVQLIGILLGDKTPILVKDLFYNITVSYEPLLR
jgi:hypothetical protein